MQSTRVPEMVLAEQMDTRHPWSAGLVSLLVHATLLVVLGVSWKLAPRGAAVDPDRAVGIVLVHQQEGKREYVDPLADDRADQPASAAALAAAMPTAADMPEDPSTALPGAEPLVGGALSEAILEATRLTGEGAPRRGGPDGGTSTEVFGITGSGSKFVYVFDRSGSMDGYDRLPLKAAKWELTRSLEDLESVHQFQIIFYNEKPRIFQPIPGKPRLAWGDEVGKRAARDFVESIVASGGTRHLEALQLALEMRPDVVFFLTDADEPRLTSAELAKVRRWNYGAMIHAIEFGYGPRGESDNFLVQLARQNGGQHAYVDISRLRIRP